MPHPSPPPAARYESAFVRELFSEMSSTYGVMNTVTSFGFSERWRCQAVKLLPPLADARVCDLMCGMGESWKYLRHHHAGIAGLTGIDFCPAMCAGAEKKASKPKGCPTRVLRADVLADVLPREAFDAVVCTFGLKTLDESGFRRLAEVLRHLLKPGGAFSFVEISVPQSPLLRGPYLFYISRIIPLLGRLFLGNPDNYRMLGNYTRDFVDVQRFHEQLQGAGFQVTTHRFFFGCATAVSGVRNP